MKFVVSPRGLAAAFVLAMLAACGGGNDGAPAASVAQNQNPPTSPAPTLSCAP
jgi:hypothetical protein